MSAWAGLRHPFRWHDYTPCGYRFQAARQDKVWADDPDGVAREYNTVLEHIETP